MRLFDITYRVHFTYDSISFGHCFTGILFSFTGGLQQAFRPFGPAKVEWPNKDAKFHRNPTKGRGKF